MKEIMAIIRMNMVNQTKKALLDAGYPSITARKVMGRGKKKIDFSLVETAGINPEGMAGTPYAEQFAEGHKLIPKRIFTMVVKDEEVKPIVNIIMKENSRGNPGDGKIFILPVLEVIRVRTGETGTSAV